MSDQLASLNEPQRDAVTHVEGPLLVLAGPGSGKTRVITHRIAYMTETQGISPDEILAVTFTNKAAEEMRRRLAQLTPSRKPWISTFHSLGARLLRQYAGRVGRSPRFSILDQSDRERLLARLMKESGIDLTHIPADAIQRRISGMKNDLVSADQFQTVAVDHFDKVLGSIYQAYEERLRSQNAFDFDDLLVGLATLVRADPEIRAELDRRFRYVLVDEYQDTNLAQYVIARGISVDHPNLCVTGDPDQSIYGWRGANLENILNFELDFPDARIIRLEENYRSTSNILGVADELIHHNRRRKEKRLVTANPPGDPVVVQCFQDDLSEASSIANRICVAVASGSRRFRDFAIFTRMVGLARTIEGALRERRVPYQVVGGTSFFERREIRDVLAYARLVLNPRDDTAFHRVVNVPARGIGETTVARLVKHAKEQGISLIEAAQQADKVAGLRANAKKALRAFGSLMDQLAPIAALTPDDALETILSRTEYIRLLEEGDEEDQQSRLGNVQEMLAEARRFTENHPDAELTQFLETISLSSDADQRDDEANLVTIMTLHAAKGLEFPVVFLIAFEHDTLPHERSVEEGHEEEERRLAFVGITRAKEELHISYTRRRLYHGSKQWRSPSRFLGELPEEFLDRQDQIALPRGPVPLDDESQEVQYIEPTVQIYSRARGTSVADRFAHGMLVDHPRYGRGQIILIEGEGKGRKATVRFPDLGERHFVLEQALLEPVASPWDEADDVVY